MASGANNLDIESQTSSCCSRWSSEFKRKLLPVVVIALIFLTLREAGVTDDASQNTHRSNSLPGSPPLYVRPPSPDPTGMLPPQYSPGSPPKVIDCIPHGIPPPTSKNPPTVTPTPPWSPRTGNYPLGSDPPNDPPADLVGEGGGEIDDSIVQTESPTNITL